MFFSSGKPVFAIANARAGVLFRAPIEIRNNGERLVEIVDVKGLPAGLELDGNTREIFGTPLGAGEHEVHLKYCFADDSSGKWSAVCLLIVNPDPESLWKKIDPPADAPWPKENEAAELVVIGERRILAGSKRGRSHAHVGSFRDDDYFIGQAADNEFVVLLVGDGAGSAKYSRRGSALATRAAGGHLVEELSGSRGAVIAAAVAARQAGDTAEGIWTEQMVGLFSAAAAAAIAAIDAEVEIAHEEGRPCHPGDFCTTLLAVVGLETSAGLFAAAFSIGDGAVAALLPVDPASLWLLGQPDGGEFAGQTRFLDRKLVEDPSAIFARVRCLFLPAGTCLLLLTDGVSDPRFATERALIDPAPWHALWQEVELLLATAEPAPALLSWLDFRVPGHHDDRTLVAYAGGV